MAETVSQPAVKPWMLSGQNHRLAENDSVSKQQQHETSLTKSVAVKAGQANSTSAFMDTKKKRIKC